MATFQNSVLQQLATLRANQLQIIVPDLVALRVEAAALAAQIAVLIARLSPPSKGKFNPPPALMKVVKREVSMSVLELQVGQTAVGKLTFDETDAPADGSVVSDNTAVATVSLDADLVTWHCVGVAVGLANISYSGTSVSPDVGAAVVPTMAVTVVAVPVAEHGDFNPAGATITGP